MSHNTVRQGGLSDNLPANSLLTLFSSVLSLNKKSIGQTWLENCHNNLSCAIKYSLGMQHRSEIRNKIMPVYSILTEGRRPKGISFRSTAEPYGPSMVVAHRAVIAVFSQLALFAQSRNLISSAKRRNAGHVAVEWVSAGAGCSSVTAQWTAAGLPTAEQSPEKFFSGIIDAGPGIDDDASASIRGHPEFGGKFDQVVCCLVGCADERVLHCVAVTRFDHQPVRKRDLAPPCA